MSYLALLLLPDISFLRTILRLGVEGTFLVSLGLLLATWIGYPLVIGLLARRRRRHTGSRPAVLPRVSLIIAAHNEAGHIEERLRNALALDYPDDRLEIIVSEDGSVDDTAARVLRYPQVRLLSHGHRLGKAEALNRAMAESRGDIVVFSDANNAYPEHALRALVTEFADPDVGAVTGRKSVSAHHGVGGGESVYWKFEGWLIEQESMCGGAVAGFGEVLALRRHCFLPLPRHVLVNDDLYLLLQVLAQNRRVVAAAEAVSEELPSARMADEWERRQRMSVGRCAALWMLKREIWKARPSFLVKLLFHQVLRQMSAIWMALALITGTPLLFMPAAADSLRLLAAAQTAFYGIALAAAAIRGLGGRPGKVEAAWFFCIAQAAALKGWWRYLRGQSSPMWKRAQRASAHPSTAHDRSGEPITGGVILNGVAWAYSSFLLGKLLVFGSIVVLARLLAPRSFGEVALALATAMVLEIFGALGLTSALIYEQNQAREAGEICFWVTMGTAVLESIGMWFAAPILARFFHEPDLVPMVRALLPCLIITVAGQTHDMLLRRQLAFHRKIIPDLGMAGAKGISSIVLALLGAGAWSLIWGQIIGSLCCTILLWMITGWVPRLHWDREVARRMFHYAKHIYLLDASGVILVNLDTITIGRMLSDSMLGFYTLAWRIPEVVLISGLNVVTRVVFPAFSRLQSDSERVRGAVLQTVRYTSMFTLPMATGIVILAPQIVMALYGWRWMPSSPVLRVLALYAGMRCITHHFGDAYKGTGHPEILSRLTLVWWLLLPPTLIVGSHYGGLIGIAWGRVAAQGVMTVLHIIIVTQILRVSLRTLWHSFAPAMEGSTIILLGLLGLAPFLHAMPARTFVAVMTTMGLLLYAAFLLLRHRPVLQHALATIRQLPRRSAAANPQPTVAAAGPK